MTLIEGALSQESRHDRSAEELRNVGQFARSLGVEDPLPRPDHGPLGLQQQPGRIANGGGIRARSNNRNRPIVEWFRSLLASDIDWNFQQHGPRPAGSQ